MREKMGEIGSKHRASTFNCFLWRAPKTNACWNKSF